VGNPAQGLAGNGLPAWEESISSEDSGQHCHLIHGEPLLFAKRLLCSLRTAAAEE